MKTKTEDSPSLNASIVLVDLYYAADGAVLRFDVQSIAALNDLAALFAKMSAHPPLTCSLLQSPLCSLTKRIRDVVMHSSRDHRTFSKSITIRPDGEAPIVNWIMNSEGWLQSSELMSALDKQGHQYLNSSSLDEASVEVSFCEVELETRAMLA